MRRTAVFLLGLLTVLAWSAPAHAQDRKYPNKPIRMQRDVPRPVIELLHSHINAVLAMPDVQKLFDKLGLDVNIMTRREFGDFIAKDAERWTNLVRDANLSL